MNKYMEKILINPEIPTLISHGIFKIHCPDNSQQISLLDSEDDVIRTLYANNETEIHHDGLVYAVSLHSKLYIYVEDLSEEFSELETDNKQDLVTSINELETRLTEIEENPASSTEQILISLEEFNALEDKSGTYAIIDSYVPILEGDVSWLS